MSRWLWLRFEQRNVRVHHDFDEVLESCLWVPVEFFASFGGVAYEQATFDG
jgi:hypothetical protein